MFIIYVIVGIIVASWIIEKLGNPLDWPFEFFRDKRRRKNEESQAQYYDKLERDSKNYELREQLDTIKRIQDTTRGDKKE